MTEIEYEFKVTQNEDEPVLIKKILATSAPQWSPFSTAEEYVAAEFDAYQLNIQDSDKILRILSFYLQDPSKDHTIASSIRVFVKKGIFKAEESSSLSSNLLFHVSYVYTVEEYRGKGLASVLINNSLKWLESEYKDTENSYLSLFSGVSEYYRRFNFKSFPDLKFHLVFSPAAELPSTSSHDVTHIGFNDKGALQSHVDQFRSKLVDEITTNCKKESAIAFEPTISNLRCFHRRERQFKPELKYCGAYISANPSSSVLWGNYISQQKLCVISININPCEKFSNLLQFKLLFNAVVVECTNRGLLYDQVVISEDGLPFEDRESYTKILREDYNSDVVPASEIRCLPALRKLGHASLEFDTEWKGIGFWCWG